MYVRTYVHMYVRVGHAQECQFALICTHVQGTHVSRALTMEAHGWGTRSRLEDREERRFLRMEDGEDSTAGPPQRTCFVESSAERIQRLAMLKKRKQRS